MKKRIFSLVLVLALVLSMIPAASAAEMSSAVIIQAQYEDAMNFSGGYAAVKKDGKWGYIDETGKVVVDFQYFWAGNFSEGVAAVAVLEKYEEQTYCVFHLIDARGMDVVLADSQRSAWGSTLGYDFYPNATVCYGGIEEVFDNWSNAYQCFDGVISVNSVPYTPDGKEIVLKESEKSRLYTPADGAFDLFVSAGPAVDGMIPMYACYLKMSDFSQYFLMDLQGNIIRTFNYLDYSIGGGISGIFAPNDDLVLAYVPHDEVSSGVWENVMGVLDLYTAEWVIEPKYTARWCLDDGSFVINDRIILADENGLWGALDTQGRIAIPFQYLYLAATPDNFIAAQKRDGTFVYLDEDGYEYQIGGIKSGIGNIVAASPFGSNGIAAVMDADGNTYCISCSSLTDVLPAVRNSDQLESTLFFPDYVEGQPYSGTINIPSDIVVYKENGLYGFKKLNVDLTLNPFSDVKKGQWFYDYVLDMAFRNIINGYEDGTFRPNEPLRRCEMVQMLYKMADCPPVTGKASFTDLEAQWYQDAIAWAEQNHIVDGMGNGKFDPNGPVTRQQLVAMLYRMSGAQKVDYKLDSKTFADVGDVHAWAMDAMCWAVSQGILNGTTLEGKTGLYLAPTDSATRAQAAKILSLYD